jgi:hypothetical protein
MAGAGFLQKTIEFPYRVTFLKQIKIYFNKLTSKIYVKNDILYYVDNKFIEMIK